MVPPQTLNNGDDLNFPANDAKLFPSNNGLIHVAGRDLNYRTKTVSRFVDVRDLNDPSPITVDVGDEIELRPHIRLESTGYYGGGDFEVSRKVSYDTPLYFSGLAEIKKTFEDAFDDSDVSSRWNTIWGTQGVSTIEGNPALQTISAPTWPTASIPRASLIALSDSEAEDALRTVYLDAGNFLSYDAQTKVGFLGDPQTYYFAGGISFRLDTNENQYGISIMRGNSSYGVIDNIDNDIVPPSVFNQVAIVLWQETNNATAGEWLAYKNIDALPIQAIQDATLAGPHQRSCPIVIRRWIGRTHRKGQHGHRADQRSPRASDSRARSGKWRVMVGKRFRRSRLSFIE